MYNILAMDKVSPSGLKAFDPENYKISEDFKDPDAIVVHSKPLHDMQFGKNLMGIVRVGAGFNTIPIDRCLKEGIAVFNTPGGNANAVKELTIAAMIMSFRNVWGAMSWVNSLSAEDVDYGSTVEAGKRAYRGPEIMGKTIGILGVGNIGSRMAKACHDLGMKVLMNDPYISNARRAELMVYGDFVEDVNEMYAKSDVVTVHIPLDETTKGFVNKASIEHMKDGAYLLNFARGPIVDNNAVVEALNEGKLTGFATDFPTPATQNHPRIICTPHLGAGTPEADINCSVMAARQIKDFLENGNVENSVNFPNLSFARADGARITVLHQNKVGMLGAMTDKIATMGINIENLANKSRGDIAYTIFDFKADVPSELKAAIEAMDGVIRVRVIN